MGGMVIRVARGDHAQESPGKVVHGHPQGDDHATQIRAKEKTMAKEYDVSRPASTCVACQKALAPGEALVATLWEAGEELQRKDYCLPCWEAQAPSGGNDLLGTWRTKVPQPEEKKKLFVDDELLMNFFERLSDAEDPVKVNFRFVLTLVLMRKKLLVYEGTEKTPDGQERWTLRVRGGETRYQVLDPHMDEDKIAEVSGQLGAILEADL